MKKNNSGKVLVIFLVIIAILLISLTAISMFFFQKEIEKRKVAETSLQDSIANGVRLEIDLKDTKKKSFLLVEKNKELDEKVNSLLDELELEHGIREEMKIEASSLNQEIEKIKSERNKLKNQVDEFKTSNDKIQELEAKLQTAIAVKSRLEARVKELEESSVKKISAVSQGVHEEEMPVVNNTPVKLDPIVVSPNNSSSGRILSVDQDTEFVIINMGSKDGITVGKMLSVYRGNEYLGDIQVTRVQPEMSAADLIPPFSSQRVRKNDQVTNQ